MSEADLPEFLRHDPPPPTEPVRTTARRDGVPGEPGLWVVVLGDLVVFAAFSVAVGWEGRAERADTAAAAGRLLMGAGALNTVVLLTGSLLVASFVQRGSRPAVVRRALWGTLACAAVFAVVKAVEYDHAVAVGAVPGAGIFFVYYWVLTGIHLAHLAVGAVLLVVLLRRVGAGTAEPRFTEGVAVYWHLVDLLWILLFGVLYVVPVT
ncbi:cytochrome c oxidase subunit 3 [Pseudonocardia sp. NPDC049154]|uniref:cytochrome c oxidase subunit 3 n=1 Tax=Pseudonocardia sp. NPDC049154 TaxID=3155501 RepID=UPI0033E2A0E4